MNHLPDFTGLARLVHATESAAREVTIRFGAKGKPFGMTRKEAIELRAECLLLTQPGHDARLDRIYTAHLSTTNGRN